MIAAITVNISPFLHVGPLTLAWHGITIAVGIAAGALVARGLARRLGLEVERLEIVLVILVGAGVVGARFYYLVQTDPSSLVRPDQWFGTVGFAFYGAILAGVGATAVYLWRKRLGVSYLDALAAGFPLGMALGRIGDLINGEHYGPPTGAPWGFVYTNPQSEPPNHDVAYQSGAFYEILLALVMLAALWPFRDRLATRPGLLLAITVAVYSLGRFLIFFVIRDTPVVALGLRQAQWTSLALLGAATAGGVAAHRWGSKLAADVGIG